MSPVTLELQETSYECHVYDTPAEKPPVLLELPWAVPLIELAGTITVNDASARGEGVATVNISMRTIASALLAKQ